MSLEKFKTSLIILLFVTSLALTYQLWLDVPIGEASDESNGFTLSEKDINLSDILSPQRFIINFEGDNHTAFFSEPYEIWNVTKPEEKEKIWIWEKVKNELNSFFSNAFELESVDHEKWTNINKFKSIRMDFACEIPANIVLSVLSENDNIMDELEQIGEINSILISSNNLEENTIYVANTEEKIYYRFKGQVISDNIKDLITNIKEFSGEKEYISYYNNILKEFLEVENDILVPIFDDISIDTIDVTNEIHPSDTVQKRTLADIFFKNSFDFVKEITENNGSSIYMYGYGDKSLKINESGTLEYIEKIDEQMASISTDFIESLKMAVAFTDAYIGWPINEQNAYISGYSIVEKDNKQGYRFLFNYRLGGLPVITPGEGQQGAIEVEVIGNQVTYYKRIVKKMAQKNDMDEEIPNIINILIKNLDIMKEKYISYNKLTETMPHNLNVRELIDDVEIVYYYVESEDKKDSGMLIPTWRVKVDNITYFFDVYEGKLIYVHKTRGV